MDSNDMIAAVIERMGSVELPVLDVDRDNKIVYSKLFLIQIQDMNRAVIYFSVSTKPDESAFVTLVFKEMKEFFGNGRLKVGESYYPVSRTEILWGDDAYKEYDKDLEDTYLKESKYDILMDDDDACFHC